METFRDDLYRYIKKKYKADPEYLWRRYPGYAAFRHSDNAKWFGLIMDVSAEKLGLSGEKVKDILNVKIADSMLTDILVRQPGFFRGYHISRGNWLSILLDGTVSFEEICRWLDESYLNTASKEEKQKLRPPKEWIVPRQYPPDQFTFERLGDEYGIHAVRGPRGIPETLGKALQENL